MTKITLTIEIPDGIEFKIEKPKPDFPPGGMISGEQGNELIKENEPVRIPKEKPFTTPDPKKSKWNPKKAKDRLCAKCGKVFQPSGPRQKYCSEECGLKPKPKGEKPKPPKIRHINEGREKSETVSSDAIFQRTCQYCGETFATMDRSDKFCGAKCEHFFKKQAK